jgi:hypothetical protein
MNKFPSETNMGVLTLDGPRLLETGLSSVTISLIPGMANTAAGIVAELGTRYRGNEPALYSLWVSKTDGSIWQHTSAGMAAGTWTALGIGVTGLNSTVAELNTLHGSGITEAQLAQLSLLATSDSATQSLSVTVPASTLVAGNVILVPAVVGKSITVLAQSITPLSTISGTGITGLLLQDDNAIPVVVDTTTNLTANVTTTEFSAAAHTLGAGFRVPLTAGKNLVLAANAVASKANFVCANGVSVTLVFQVK